jgi:phosphoribosylformylglycinamidine cyclo-ligase
VDIAAADAVKEKIKSITAGTQGPGALLGFFAGAFEPYPGSDILLVASTDSVGTKQKVAQAADRYTSIGFDIVNHCVNDILPTGATPLFFLDYIGTGKLDQRIVTDLVEGIAAACREAECALIGGETAELPGLYKGSDFDLVGFIVGSVKKNDFVGGNRAEAGDVLIGLPSSGLHTNGYSLVRSVFEIEKRPEILEEWVPALESKLGDALLEPHHSYLQSVRPIMGEIRGMAHITGGGIPGNLPRVLPEGLGAELDMNSWEVPPLFRLIQERGGIEEAEMYRVFNMGIGMILVVPPDAVSRVVSGVEGAWKLGRVTKQAGDTRVVFTD